MRWVGDNEGVEEDLAMVVGGWSVFVVVAVVVIKIQKWSEQIEDGGV